MTALAAGHAALLLVNASLPLLGGLLLLAGATTSPATGAIYALAGQVTPPGTRTETFAWLLSANATGAAIGSAIAGILSQTAGPQGAFALAAAAGALAGLIVITRRPSLRAELEPASIGTTP